MAHIWGKRIGTTGLATVLTLSMAACGGQSAGSDPSAADPYVYSQQRPAGRGLFPSGPIR